MRGRRSIAVVSMLLLLGCATADEMVLPDGTKGYKLNCDGAMLSMGDCYKKAGDLCPQGYDLSDTTFYAQGGYVLTHEVYVRCK